MIRTDVLYEGAQVLTKQGWGNIRSGSLACVRNGVVEWCDIDVKGRFKGAFCYVFCRYGGVCVDAHHEVPTVPYASHIQGQFPVEHVPAGDLSPDWVLVNNFNTLSFPRENPFLPYVGSYTKHTESIPLMGSRSGYSWQCLDDVQFRLVPDILRYDRYESLLKWHGRSYVEDLNGRKMRGVSEFANYSDRATDIFELAGLGAGKRVERLSPRRLRVHDRWCLRVDKHYRFTGWGYSLEGDSSYLLTRFQGVIGLVRIND